MASLHPDLSKLGMMMSQTRVSDAGLDVKNQLLTHLENWMPESEKGPTRGPLNLLVLLIGCFVFIFLV